MILNCLSLLLMMFSLVRTIDWIWDQIRNTLRGASVTVFLWSSNWGGQTLSQDWQPLTAVAQIQRGAMGNGCSLPAHCCPLLARASVLLLLLPWVFSSFTDVGTLFPQPPNVDYTLEGFRESCRPSPSNWDCGGSQPYRLSNTSPQPLLHPNSH